MTRLAWDNSGDRRFEAGVDRAVLYTTNGVGIAWNGLTSVKESSPGGDASSFYLDGIRYLNLIGREEFDGTIEAYTYPDEFGIHDGTSSLSTGLILMQQKRKPFAFSYRTRVGNDIDGTDRGYKIHIIYNALAQPSEKAYTSLGDRPEPISFSWNFVTVPKRPVSEVPLAPLSHIVIDTTKTSAQVLRWVEEQLYGSSRQSARLIGLNELIKFFEHPQFVYSIFAHPDTGLSQLIFETDGIGDLIGDDEKGLYSALSDTRLVPTAKPGFYTLES